MQLLHGSIAKRDIVHPQHGHKYDLEGADEGAAARGQVPRADQPEGFRMALQEQK